MAHGDSVAGSLECPFGRLDGLSRSDLRETAYELFFMACRASNNGGSNYCPVIGMSEACGDGPSSPRSSALMTANRRVKKALGLTRKSGQLRTVSVGGGNYGGFGESGKVKRPMTSAEIMRLQMMVTDQSDSRLRKTLIRTLVGQAGRRAETIILPLELLRQVRPSEFSGGAQEYHHWQRRQLKVLEAGLLVYPSLPLDSSSKPAALLRGLIDSTNVKPIDTLKSSELMRTLNDSVNALAWRGANGKTSDVCHWVDSYPVNILVYVALLHSIFDLKEETVVLDEVDELIELMKKTWSTLRIDKEVHNVCFSWVLFQRYVETGEVEAELLSATTAMLAEVSEDAKRPAFDPFYAKTLTGAIGSMRGWAEKKLMDYHEWFANDAVGGMDDVIDLGLATWKMVAEDLQGRKKSYFEEERKNMEADFESRVRQYINSSLRNALTKLLNNASNDEVATEAPSEILIKLAKEAEVLALIEREKFSPILKKWHPHPSATAAVTIHIGYGVMFRQYLTKATTLSPELVRVLQAAGKLEKALLQVIVEDTEGCEDDEKIVAGMEPYDVENIFIKLLKAWIDEKLRLGNECLMRAKDTESWCPKSKSEPYAQSAVDIMKIVETTLDEFFAIQMGVNNEMFHELASGLEMIVSEYISFVASCGTKQNYVSTLPSLTRCNQPSTLVTLLKKATVCHSGAMAMAAPASKPSLNALGPLTSRGTQRLYIRLNTLHYLVTYLHALHKSLSLSSPSAPFFDSCVGPSRYFSTSLAVAAAAAHHISELAAFRLVFLDSRTSFHEGDLYARGVYASRIAPALNKLKEDLALLVSVLVDRAQPMVVNQVMKASFEAFLLTLLAGGKNRAFHVSDHEVIADDFDALKRVFVGLGEGVLTEDVVEREAEPVERILSLMGQPTERLIEDFTIVAYEANGDVGEMVGGMMAVPATTGKWSKADPNTVLRVLCHRNDAAANHFLKTNFQLPRRK